MNKICLLLQQTQTTYVTRNVFTSAKVIYKLLQSQSKAPQNQAHIH